MFQTPKKWLSKALKKQKKVGLTRCENTKKLTEKSVAWFEYEEIIANILI